uniref:Secreted protein n=2 Tax=Caenorhabditis japonica TaxID=281687 RepID=A0A8R1IA68_CAEJA
MLNFVIYSLLFSTSEAGYCASNNMKENFLGKQRGPPNRIGEPKVFSDDCQSSTWVIKDRSSDDCGPHGFCFKWSQGLNNSGSYTYMTFRGCYNKLYNTNDPSTFAPPNHSFCTNSNVFEHF